jgi:uncharacterized protein YwgA
MVNNEIEAVVNRLLTLFLIREAYRNGWPITGKVKLLKLIYLSEQKMLKDRLKGFSYSFYRWDYGPLSVEALKDYEYLVSSGLIKESDYRIQLTERGMEILEHTKELLNQNEDILNYIRKAIREFGSYTGTKIKKAVYDLPKMEEKKLIFETKHGEELLQKIGVREAKKIFLIDDEWLETISILMDKELLSSLEKGIKDAREGKIKRYAPLSQEVT